jgi:predicted MFS family arabinose efflux permease
MVFVPLTQEVATHWGWHAGFLFLSALVFLLVLPVNLFIIRVPKNGEAAQERDLFFWKKGTQAENLQVVIVDPDWAGKVWTPRKALGTRRFWTIFFAGFTGSALVIQTVFSHFIVMTTDVGYSPAFSSKMLGLAGLMGTVGFFFWGKLADRIGREWGYTLGTICLFCGLFFLFLMKGVRGTPVFVAFAMLFGFGYGSRAPLMQSICADIFQGPHFASILGMYQMSLGVGVVGPWLAGVVAGILKSYQPIILFLMGSLFVSCIMVWFAAPRHVRRTVRRGGTKPEPAR